MPASPEDKAEYTDYLKTRLRDPSKRWEFWADVVPNVALNLRSQEDWEREWAEDSLECLQEAFADPSVYGGALIDLSSEEMFDQLVGDVNNCVHMLNSMESGDNIFEWTSAAMDMAGTLASRYVVKIAASDTAEQA